MTYRIRSQNPQVEAGPERPLAMISIIVVLGAIMTVLDATIVSAAMDTLARDFDAALPTIQWVPTAYALALAAVIPPTGWAADRFGGKAVQALMGATLHGAMLLLPRTRRPQSPARSESNDHELSAA